MYTSIADINRKKILAEALRGNLNQPLLPNAPSGLAYMLNQFLAGKNSAEAAKAEGMNEDVTRRELARILNPHQAREVTPSDIAQFGGMDVQEFGELNDENYGEWSAQKDMLNDRQGEADFWSAVSQEKAQADRDFAPQSPDAQRVRLAQALQPGANSTAQIRNYQYMQNLPEDQREEYMSMFRGPQTIGLGDRTVVLDPTNPTREAGSFEEGLAPSDQPENVAAREEATQRSRLGVQNEFEAGAAKERMDEVTANSDRLIAQLDDLLGHEGLGTATGFSGLAHPGSWIPGMKGRDAKALINTIKNQVFVDTLQSIRRMSPTGGAVGNVSDTEGQRMENAIVALDNAQSDEQFVQQLQNLRQISQDAKQRIIDAYNQQFGGAVPETGDEWEIVE